MTLYLKITVSWLPITPGGCRSVTCPWRSVFQTVNLSQKWTDCSRVPIDRCLCLHERRHSAGVAAVGRSVLGVPSSTSSIMRYGSGRGGSGGRTCA
jgi:hypothetical protein